VGPDNLREFIGPFALFLIKQAFFDAAEDDAIGSFDGAVWLRVIRRGKDYLYAHGVTEFSEELWIKLFDVIYGDLPWDPEPADDVLPEEFFDYFWGDVA